MAGMKGRRGRGDGGKGWRRSIERSNRLRRLSTQRKCRRPKKFWSYYNSSQKTKENTEQLLDKTLMKRQTAYQTD